MPRVSRASCRAAFVPDGEQQIGVDNAPRHDDIRREASLSLRHTEILLYLVAA